MRYRNDFSNITPSDSSRQDMNRPCGAFNAGLTPIAAQPFGSMIMGMQQPYSGMVQPSQLALPAMPTGFPTGGGPLPLLPAAVGMPGAITPAAGGIPGTITPPAVASAAGAAAQVPATVESTLFTPGFLKTQIGRRVRVEFLIGTSNLTDRTGTLVGVGASYILIRLIDSDDIMMCDMYSIKFVTLIM